jgi:hypothetical protein
MHMSKKQTISSVLRQAVKDSGKTVYAVASGAGLSYDNLMRFVARDRELLQRESDLLADYLGCRLIPPKVKQADEPGVAR